MRLKTFWCCCLHSPFRVTGYWFLLESSCIFFLQGLSTGREVCREPYFSSGKNSYFKKSVQSHADRCHQKSCGVENISEVLYLQPFNFTVLCGGHCLGERKLNQLPETFRKSIFVFSSHPVLLRQEVLWEASWMGCHCQGISISIEMAKNRKNLCKPVFTPFPTVRLKLKIQFIWISDWISDSFSDADQVVCSLIMHAPSGLMRLLDISSLPASPGMMAWWNARTRMTDYFLQGSGFDKASAALRCVALPGVALSYKHSSQKQPRVYFFCLSVPYPDTPATIPVWGSGLQRAAGGVPPMFPS